MPHYWLINNHRWHHSYITSHFHSRFHLPIPKSVKINSRTRLYNAAASPASRLRSAGSLAINFSLLWLAVTDCMVWACSCSARGLKKHSSFYPTNICFLEHEVSVGSLITKKSLSRAIVYMYTWFNLLYFPILVAAFGCGVWHIYQHWKE